MPPAQDKDVESPPVGRTTAHQYSLNLEEDATKPVPVTPPSAPSYKQKDSYFLSPPPLTPEPSPPPSPQSFTSAQDTLAEHPWDSIIDSDGAIRLIRRNDTSSTLSNFSLELDPTVDVEVNGVTRRLPKDVPVSLEMLSLPPQSFLFIDAAFIKTDRRGVPLKKREVEDGMKIDTKPYPSMEPLATLYFLSGRYCPSKKKVAKWLQSTWGRAITNALIASLMAFMARPSLKGDTTMEIIISVVAGARMFDLIIRDTLIKFLSEASLTTSLLLFLLTTFQLCFMIGASIPFACLRHLEWHALPSLLFIWLVIAPVLHQAWLQLARRRKGGGLLLWAGRMVAVYGPVVALVGLLSWDIFGRVGEGEPAFLACRPLNATGAKDGDGARAIVKIVQRL
ncbi:hypothetical protein HDV00_010679, partial [Rhizophlyctis rosea]